MKNLILIKSLLLVVTLLLISTPIYGVESDMHKSESPMDDAHSVSMDKEKTMQHGDHADTMTAEQQKDMFLEKREIENYTVSFHVMRANPGMEHGGSHNFMVKIEQGDNIVEDVVINSKVISPDNSSESKRLLKMGDWYMNGYDLGEEGEYQLIILFKTSDGKKHKGGVYYQEKPDK